ncbi:hypothetical protein ACJIZ3_008243 [Penstemon smallii]|uniref:Leucine-rich repeat-containing N-terminal plant-type domain-containing protein n=1 Tax=Penstemon smallii TaxID=265156 RepID=A0ABD3T968_9LAMI
MILLLKILNTYIYLTHQMIFNNMNFFTCLHLFIFSIPFLLQNTTHSLNCLQNEKLALLKFKSELIDDYDRLSTWGTSNKVQQNCCKWTGVLCHNRTNHVVALDLGGPSNVLIERYAPLRGKISSSLLELSDLSYLDLSSNDFNGTQIPDFFGFLSKLRYLNLNFTNFGGLIPQGLGNLSLSYLGLSANNFTGGIPESLGNMLSLSHFDLSLNKLEGKIPDSLGNLISISFLDFSDNQLQGEVPTFKNLSSLRFLDFSGNKFSGQASNVMNSLWNSSMLEIIDLSENFFYGSLPRIPRFRFLKELRLQSNEFNGSFVEGNLRLPSLEVLDVSGNRFSGSVPNLSLCYSLRVLNLTDNMFNGTLTQSIGYLSKLEYLGLGSNHLEGIISEPNLFNLSNLQKLDLSFNTNLTIRVASNWNPPFRLDTISLAYCELGPRFPEWLRNQTLVQDLDISNAKIYDTIPHWFWDNSESLLTVNMSSNKIYGVLPDLASKLVSLTSVDLSSNELNDFRNYTEMCE